jgi:hypothetical protein
MNPPPFSGHTLSEFRTDIVGKGLWLLIVVRTISVSVVVGVRVICWTDVIHLQHISALWAALDWAVSGHLKENISAGLNDSPLDC